MASNYTVEEARAELARIARGMTRPGAQELVSSLGADAPSHRILATMLGETMASLHALTQIVEDLLPED